MRRTTARRLFAATLLVASVLAPMAVAPTPAVHAAGADQADHQYDTCAGKCLDPVLSARLDKAIEDVREQAGIPGVVVGLWMPGKGDYVRATGVANKVTGAPMAADSYIRIGSETKTFTVTALLELVDEHRIGLDDPISAYVPGVRKGDRITLRQLAEMRSGLFPYTADADFVHDLLSDPYRSYTPRELLAYGMKHKNTFEPGAEFQYSNTNLILLGLVIEKVSGQRLEHFIRDRVLRPSHLRKTLFPTGPEFPRPHAHGYTDQTLSGRTEDATHWNPSWAWAAGAMISDLHDLRRWAEILATGKLLSPETQAQRLKTLPTTFPGLSYGLGIFETGGWIGHNGSLPGYETVTIYLPSQKATLVIMINTDSLSGGQEPSTLLARAVTQIVTPNNVYDGGVGPR
ncbi:D-alanyl-D-alanine carboxypeptidase precursor [Streptomyces sp. ADI96-02]|uniref:serine hydrolase domain-containing protein n=1 Tax=unclassified Streptomyces TaxID=2593676 RepID=UPI000F550C45|nr:serine hydrolase domain-containing protein [Streptomyces sp. ADI96-02]RPK62542.1 D-alanyl-D-alanine carboxypeptidase precursor [Streptomyces sp. ADI96-02]